MRTAISEFANNVSLWICLLAPVIVLVSLTTPVRGDLPAHLEHDQVQVSLPDIAPTPHWKVPPGVVNAPRKTGRHAYNRRIELHEQTMEHAELRHHAVPARRNDDEKQAPEATPLLAPSYPEPMSRQVPDMALIEHYRSIELHIE
ncbi:MAG: hypothetical protein AAF682_04735 [Planctomycetota bacterium]